MVRGGWWGGSRLHVLQKPKRDMVRDFSLNPATSRREQVGGWEQAGEGAWGSALSAAAPPHAPELCEVELAGRLRRRHLPVMRPIVPLAALEQASRQGQHHRQLQAGGR